MWMGKNGVYIFIVSFEVDVLNQLFLFSFAKNVDLHCQKHILYYGPSPPPSVPPNPTPAKVCHASTHHKYSLELAIYHSLCLPFQ